VSIPTRRIVTLLDLLTFIAATAVGLALLRVSIGGIRLRTLAGLAGPLSQSRIFAGQIYASCFLAPWSLALLALNLRAPQASDQRVVRGPGFRACLAATIGMAPSLPLLFMEWSPAFFPLLIQVVNFYAGLMVAGAWLQLVLELRWRSETDWVGWAGRIVGISWI
jgi:hypothetical protein